MLSNFLNKILPSWDNAEKCGTATQAIGDMLDK